MSRKVQPADRSCGHVLLGVCRLCSDERAAKADVEGFAKVVEKLLVKSAEDIRMGRLHRQEDVERELG